MSYTLTAGQEIESLARQTAPGSARSTSPATTFAQTITGNAGANVINGGGGADIMRGLGGNDTYYVDNVGDVVNEAAGGGNDQVLTSVSYTLTAGQEIESLSTTNSAGTGAINLTGNTFAQTITGNAGANSIDGGAGADTMRGLGGNDTYFVDNAGRLVNEAAGGGSDRVLTSVNYTLTAGQEIESLSTTNNAGTGAINLAGNTFAQTITGNAGANIIDGGAGNDTLDGLGGADQFKFDTVLNPLTNVDNIVDFAAGTDKIDMSHTIFSALSAGTLSSTAFFAGTAAQNAGEHVIYNPGTGGPTTIPMETAALPPPSLPSCPLGSCCTTRILPWYKKPGRDRLRWSSGGAIWTRIRDLRISRPTRLVCASSGPSSRSVALGLAVDHLMSKPAFASLPFGEWSRVLVGQINRGHYVFAVDSDKRI